MRDRTRLETRMTALPARPGPSGADSASVRVSRRSLCVARSVVSAERAEHANPVMPLPRMRPLADPL